MPSEPITDPTAALRADGKLHFLLIQGNRFLSTEFDPLEDFEHDSLVILDEFLRSEFATRKKGAAGT
jgi:hypothetical protein